MVEKNTETESTPNLTPQTRKPIRKPIRTTPRRSAPAKEGSRVVKAPVRSQRSRSSQAAAPPKTDEVSEEKHQPYDDIVDHYSRTKAAPSHRDMKDRAHYLENLSEFDSEFDTTVLDPEGA